MHFSSTLLFSNSIWGISIYPHCKQVSMKEAKLSKLIRRTLPLPLKGGNGEEPGQEPDDYVADTMYDVFCKVVVFSLIYQPFKVTRFLIQCGYEPVRPYSIMSRGFIDFLMDRPLSTYTYLPGIIGYSRGLYRQYGLGSFFAGLGPSMLEVLMDLVTESYWAQRVDNFLLNMFNFNKKEEKYPYFNSKQVLVHGLKSSILQFIILLHSYPFFVVGNVSILRCIKGEPSVWFWTIMHEVWNEAGFAGFFSGFLAVFAYRLINVWCEEVTLELMRLFMQRLHEDHAVDTHKNAIYTMTHWIITSITYPLNLIGNIMSVNKCSARNIQNKLPYWPVFVSWIACSKYLYDAGIWFRGASVLQRRVLNTES